MGSRRTLVVMAAIAVVVLGTAANADATTGSEVANWQLNEPFGARTMADSSGHRLDGTIGAEVGTDLHTDGAIGYRFGKLQPDTPPTHPGHLVTVPDSAELNPGTRDFAVTVRLRTTYQFGNIIQKGQATVRGGNFKMQIPNGIVECVFRGSRGTMLVASTSRLNDGQWHVVRCDRGYDGLELSVDGSTEARRAGWTGPIENDWPLAIGGKTTCDQAHVGCDYYAGDLDYVLIDAG